MKGIGMILALLLPCVLLLQGCGGPLAGQDAEFIMRFGHDLLEDTPQHQAALYFKELVEDRSEGRINVQVFPAGQLGTDVETAEMMQVDTVQAALVPTAKLSGLHPPLQVLDMPFLFPSREVTYATLDDVEFRDTLFAPMTRYGLKGISFWESGFKQFTANKPLTSPEDFKGMKFRTMESTMLLAQFRALGANPVPIDLTETYNSLQQGVVDGQENPLVTITKLRFYEVQKDITVSNHGYLAYAFLMSNKFWNTLPEDLQQIVQDAADAAATLERQITVDSETGYLEIIAASGTTIHTLDKEQTEAFSQALRPVHEQFRDVVGSDVLDKVYELIERHNAEA